MATVTFAREDVSADFLTEALPLLTEHWREIAAYSDIPLSVDEVAYLAAQEAGAVRLFTVREGLLLGYACFFVRPHIHYASSAPQAVQDVVYLHPSLRGNRVGADFLGYCDEQLCAEGVQVVHHHVKLAHPQLGNALERMGYQAVETVYSRRLDTAPEYHVRFTHSERAFRHTDPALFTGITPHYPASRASDLLDFAALMGVEDGE